MHESAIATQAKLDQLTTEQRVREQERRRDAETAIRYAEMVTRTEASAPCATATTGDAQLQTMRYLADWGTRLLSIIDADPSDPRIRAAVAGLTGNAQECIYLAENS